MSRRTKRYYVKNTTTAMEQGAPKETAYRVSRIQYETYTHFKVREKTIFITTCAFSSDTIECRISSRASCLVDHRSSLTQKHTAATS